MLDAFALVLAQIFFDLADAVGFLFVQRDADQTVRRCHGTRQQAGILALDVEIADLTEVEEVLVILGPIVHAALVDIVRQVIDHVEATAFRMAVDTVEIFEIDVIDGLAVLETVDQIDRGAANALDGRQAQFGDAGFRFDRLGAFFQGEGIGLFGILHAEAHARRGWAVLGGEEGGGRARLVIDQEVDIALAPQLDVLGAVVGDMGEAHRLEDGFNDAAFRGGEFHEFKAAQAHRIFKQICHVSSPGLSRRAARTAGARPRF